MRRWLVLAGCLVAACAERPLAPRPAAPTAASPAPSVAPVVSSGKLPYPPTRVVSARDTLHGVSVEDPYRWLENGSDREVQAWAQAQDRFARERLDALPLTAELRRRFAELYYVAERDPPFRAGPRYFWSERDRTQEKNVVRFRQGKTGEARTVLDPNTWSSDGSLARRVVRQPQRQHHRLPGQQERGGRGLAALHRRRDRQEAARRDRGRQILVAARLVPRRRQRVLHVGSTARQRADRGAPRLRRDPKNTGSAPIQ